MYQNMLIDEQKKDCKSVLVSNLYTLKKDVEPIIVI